MPSLIPGYEYDIFISYRQKDNKGDRWVSEFVEALKTELESTFKEEISVYFDINPHDGLLETHDVDASLKEKLKCLVFIPITSRTYCDPKSFAWEHEFKAFVEQASKDQFGLKIKLPNGNVANRVLPVHIHDLEKTDIKLFESVLKGASGGIEFIYKSAEINRPLRSKEDSPGDNLNRTFYRDQITKTALAINKIILGLKGKPEISDKEISEQNDNKDGSKVVKSARLKKNKLLIGAGIVAILIIAGIFAYPKIFKRDKLERLVSKDGRIPIAVMPFQNMTNDTLWDVWQNGIQNMLITNLSNLNELKVRQLGTITNILKSKSLTDYASLTPSVAGSISKKLETNVNITGSIKQSGSTIRVNAQLVGTKTGEALKSFQIDGIADNILPVIDSLSVMIQDFLLISVLQKEEPNSDHYPPFPTKSPEAYRYLIYGNKAFGNLDFPTAIDMYMQALKIDSTNLYDLYPGIAAAYGNQGLHEQAKEWSLRAYRNLDKMKSMGDKIFTNLIYAGNFQTPNESIRYAEQLIYLDDQDPGGYYTLGDLYWTMHQYDKAIPEFEKSLEIYKKWDSKPMWVPSYTELGESYHGTGQYKKEKKLYKKAEQDFPDDWFLTHNQAILALTEEDTVAANRYIEKFISLCNDQSMSEARIADALAGIYIQGGFWDKAEEYRRKALALEPENWVRMNNLAYILIDKERNSEEGLELIDRALKLSPNTYNLYHWKGWGFYKQGKYKEALELLEKADSLKPAYDYRLYIDLEAAKKAVASQKRTDS
jgi:tetratricopeptide (TPR) repeat protein